jgi:hypothetical protein
MVDRNAQSVARWEKSADVVPIFVDLTIRARFAQRFEPTLSVKDVLSYVDGTGPQLPEQILLRFHADSWRCVSELEVATSAQSLVRMNVEQVPAGSYVVISNVLQAASWVVVPTEAPRLVLAPSASRLLPGPTPLSIPLPSHPIRFTARKSSNADYTVH